MLQLKQVCKTIQKKRIIENVSLFIKPGEIVGLLGPNGAGKTTSFYVLVGLNSPSKGSVYLNETDITDFPMYKRARLGLGYLPQESSIFKKMTVEENIRSIWEIRPVVEKSKQQAFLDELFSELSIEHIRYQRGIELSGGEKRRVEIVRTLAMKPSYILFDEPFAGIDPIAVQDIQHIILMLKKRNIGVLLTDHNVSETLNITDRSYIMHNGSIILEGNKDDILQNEKIRSIYLGNKFN